MGGVLALDLATNCGWAFGKTEDGSSPTALQRAAGAAAPPYISNSHRIAKPKCPLGEFFDNFSIFLSDLIEVNNPEFIVFEAPWVGGKTSQDTARKLMGLACFTEYVAHIKGISQNKVFEVNNREVRTYFIGGNSGGRDKLKARTIAACHDLGWSPVDDDAADALAVLDFAIHRLTGRKTA